MDFIVDIFLEFIIYGILQYPGAAIRWLFIRKRKTFKELLKDNFEINAFLAIIMIGCMVVLYQIIK